MSAAKVDFDIYEGEDWAVQLWWTNGDNVPYFVAPPIRMEIRNSVGGVVITLQSNETSTDFDSDPDNQSILYNSESGLIQLHIKSEDTDKLGASGAYLYDLFTHYRDPVTGKVRKRPLITGKVNVTRRVTQNV